MSGAGERLGSGMRLDGRYRLAQPLGKGGFGSVWVAEDERGRGEKVAVKVLHPEHRASSWVVERFVQEGQLLSRLEHPGVARVIGSGRSGDHVYLAMELIDGRTLEAECFARGTAGDHLSMVEIDGIFTAVLDAVAAAHERGIVHRDLKPANIMLPRGAGAPKVKVLDFGIAKALYDATRDGTTVGRMLGSAAYMSPEQVRGPEITARGDVFALGAILFELLTLRKAWLRDAKGQPAKITDLAAREENSAVAILWRVMEDPTPLPSAWRQGTPPAIDAVIEKAMAKLAADRFSDAAELRAAWQAAMSSAMSAALGAPVVAGDVTLPGPPPAMDEPQPHVEPTWVYPQAGADTTNPGTPTPPMTRSPVRAVTVPTRGPSRAPPRAAPRTPPTVPPLRPRTLSEPLAPPSTTPPAREWSKLQVALVSAIAASVVSVVLTRGMDLLQGQAVPVTPAPPADVAEEAPAPVPEERAAPEPIPAAENAGEVAPEHAPAEPPSPDPARVEASRRAAAPARAPRPATAPEPAPRVDALAQLRADVAAARDAGNTTAVRGLSSRLIAAAAALPDAAAREEITGCARASATIGDLAELSSCLDALLEETRRR